MIDEAEAIAAAITDAIGSGVLVTIDGEFIAIVERNRFDPTLPGSWNDTAADPLADIDAMLTGIWNDPEFSPDTLFMTQARYRRLTYTLHRIAIGKPTSKRSWRRHRGRVK